MITYEMLIQEELESDKEVVAVALVDSPAIKENMLAFNEAKQLRFKVYNEDERIIIGPAMVPNQLIYRRENDGTEYQVFASEKTIQMIAEKFFAKGFQNNANEMHDPEKPVDVSYFMSWIADEKKGIPKLKGFEHLPDGTWFLGGKVKEDSTWAKVKDGTFKGLSIEGKFLMKPVKMNADETLRAIQTLLKDI